MLWDHYGVKKTYSYYDEKFLDRFKKVIKAGKNVKTTKNARRRKENKLELFAEVLADPENNFAISMERLVLK